MLAPRDTAPSEFQTTRLRAIEAQLSIIPEAPFGTGPVPQWLVPALGKLFRCERVCAYRPRGGDDVWGLGDYVTAEGETFFARYDEELRGTPTPFHYDPLHPETEQRNRALTLRETHTHGPETTCVIDDMWPRRGLVGHDQLRALVCDGPVLLAWVGGLREEPFTACERDLLNALVRPMQRALSLRRILLDGGLAVSGLAAALEAIGSPAFVARRDGAVTHVNSLGSALLEGRRRAVQERLRNAIAGGDHVSSVARLDAPGLPESFLVMLRDAEGVLCARLVDVQRRWGVTHRELEVLRWVVSGDSNKEIALKVRLHESSVERHVTALLRKAKCDARSRLVACFWTS